MSAECLDSYSMNSIKTNSPLLSEEQIQQLAEIVLEELGSGPCESDVTDYIGQLLEDVSGFETVDDSIRVYYINLIRSAYDDHCSD